MDSRLVDDRRHAPLVGHLGLTPYGDDDLVTSSRTRCSASAQATASSIRTVPATTPACGMTLGAEPARTMPHTTLDAGAGVEPPAQHRRQLGDQLAEREGEVLGEVRAAGVAALAGEPDAEACRRRR